MKPIISKNLRIRYPEYFQIGDFSIVDDFSYFATRLIVGRGTHLAAGLNFAGGPNHTITIGDFCGISSGSCVLCGSSNFVNALITIPPPGETSEDISGDVTFENFTGVGTNSIVMPDNHIPEGCGIGALSFVRSKAKLEPWTVYGGNPLREICKRNKDSVMRQAERYYRAINK